MTDQYSIAEARQNFAAIVRKLDRSHCAEITRRGKSVAILVSTEEYKRLTSKKADFWQAYLTFRENVDLKKLKIDPDLFEGLRVDEPGRVVDL